MSNYRPGQHNPFMNDGRFQPPWPRTSVVNPVAMAEPQYPVPMSVPSECGVGGSVLGRVSTGNGPTEGIQTQMDVWQNPFSITATVFQNGRKKRKQQLQGTSMTELERKAKQSKVLVPFEYRIGGFIKSMEDSRREMQNQVRGAEVIEEASKRYLKDVEQQVRELLLMREKNQEKESLLRQQLLASPVFAADEVLERLRLIHVLQYGTTEMTLTEEMKLLDRRESETMERIRLYGVYAADLQKRIRELSQIHFTSETVLQERQLKEMKEFLEGNRREKELLLHQQNSLKDLLLQQADEWKRLTCTVHAQFMERKNKIILDQLLEKSKREKEELAQDHMLARSALVKEASEAKQLADRLRHELELRKTHEGSGSGHTPLTSTECIVCFHEMDNHGRMRALLSPCHHAGLCIPCAALCWNKNRKCPVCRIDLTQKPQAIPPVVYF